MSTWKEKETVKVEMALGMNSFASLVTYKLMP
jgi:hypothetical protein